MSTLIVAATNCVHKSCASCSVEMQTPNGIDYPVCVHCAVTDTAILNVSVGMDDPGMASRPGGDDQWCTPHLIIGGSVTGEIPPVLNVSVEAKPGGDDQWCTPHSLSDG
eukprot:3491816-Amphidinium_carterae.1